MRVSIRNIIRTHWLHVKSLFVNYSILRKIMVNLCLIITADGTRRIKQCGKQIFLDIAHFCCIALKTINCILDMWTVQFQKLTSHKFSRISVGCNNDYVILTKHRLQYQVINTINQFLFIRITFSQKIRLIDNLMTDALTIGSQQDKKVIDAEIIRAAVDNQGLYWWSFQSTFLRLWLLSWPYFKSSTAAFQTRLRQSAVIPSVVCVKFRYGTIGEASPPKIKCDLPLPQCAVWQYSYWSVLYFHHR